MNLQYRFEHKTALVCGATQGIGFATAELFAKSGANLILIARNSEKLTKVKQELAEKYYCSVETLVADFQNPDGLSNVINNCEFEVDILVNNTGGPAGGPVYSAKTAEFHSAFSAHLICNHILVQRFAPKMQVNGFGRIVNVVSTSVKQPLPNLGVSNTIRGAVASWAKTMSNELAAFGITVNNVLPGATKTGRLESIIENKATKLGKSNAEVEQEMINEIPAKRLAYASEIANAILFLASEEASYINGVSLAVDGGRTSSL